MKKLLLTLAVLVLPTLSAKAQDFYGVATIVNRCPDVVVFDSQVGDNRRESWELAPGGSRHFYHPYASPNEHRSPPLIISFPTGHGVQRCQVKHGGSPTQGGPGDTYEFRLENGYLGLYSTGNGHVTNLN